MNKSIAVLVSFVFLLQTFVTAIAISVNQIDLVEKVETSHSCCSTKITKDSEKDSKKNCCSGEAKMSCCVVVYGIEPVKEDYKLLQEVVDESPQFSIVEMESNYLSSFFHPPEVI